MIYCIVYCIVFIIAVVAEKNAKVESTNISKEKTEDETLHQSGTCVLKDQTRTSSTSSDKEDFVVKVNVAAQLKELKNKTREFKDTMNVKAFKEVRKQSKHERKVEDEKNNIRSNANLENAEEKLAVKNTVTTTKSVDSSKVIHKKVPRKLPRRKQNENIRARKRLESN